MKYRKEIDGLRALAVMPVILFHADFTAFSGGFIGVDIFFVISGYLITTIIQAELEQAKFSIVNFYERRARRILPALFLVMLACIPFAWFWLLPSDMKAFSQSLVAVSVFASNILFWHESGYFDTATELKPLLHTWSLAVEEQYYVLFPLFLMLLWKLGKRWMLILLGLVFVISLALAQWAAYAYPAAAFYLLPTRGWELLIGAFAAFYLSQANRKKFGKDLSEVGSWLGVTLIFFAVFTYRKSTPFPGLYALVPTIGAALIILFATELTLVGKLLSNRLLVGIGLISYSAYLWHQPLFSFARYISSNELNIFIMSLLFLGVLVLATITWRFVEQPFRRKGAVSSFLVFTTAGVISIFFIVIGEVGNFNEGFPQRFDSLYRSINKKLVSDGKDRQIAIKADICHFNNLTKIGVDNFLKQWNCRTDNNVISLKRIPLIVTGDSHSADQVVALKLNGLVPFQIGGAGCSLIPSKMTDDCKKIFKYLNNEVKDDKYYEYLAIVNKFSDDELTVDSINEMIMYWNTFNKKIIFFTGLPTFPRFSWHLENGLVPIMDLRIADLSRNKNIIKLLELNGVYIVDRNKYFCLINNCNFIARNGANLLTDDTHLSSEGAKLFGKVLLENDPLFNKWTN